MDFPQGSCTFMQFNLYHGGSRPHLELAKIL